VWICVWVCFGIRVGIVKDAGWSVGQEREKLETERFTLESEDHGAVHPEVARGGGF